ncbi:helix-turn-helix domain-containing protein [Salipiger bermudensis]|uniref:helix-turn-helix domain-containing protein n=1 Tax=Salipiger bermudensis TaxID=344736 RepID=UPI001CD7BD93|nr:helix-turn-helix domain-containing protein [Salipiger bermudensis]MCA0962414.1 helix-turn-helix domain-containing protein [Salipiger bermudensis]
MSQPAHIPNFNLFGETTAFPDVVHCEAVLDRAGQHGWRISPHRHTQMAQVFQISSGAAQVTLDGLERRLEPGQYLYIPPQVVHGFAFTRGTEGTVLSVPSPVVARLGPQAPALSDWLGSTQHGALSDGADALLTSVVEAYTSNGNFRAQRLVALTHALLAALAAENTAKGASPRGPNTQMQQLDALITAHLGEGWRAREYASALHVTTGHLNRVVRGAAGMSLTAYLETAVMTEACRLIAFTRLPVAEVGYRLGYADPPYFSRRFRLRMGETPSAYRMRVSGERPAE